MKHRLLRTPIISRINYFFTNQTRFFKLYSEKPKFIFNLFFHILVSVLSIFVLNNAEIKNYIRTIINNEKNLNIKSTNTILNISYSPMFLIGFKIFTIIFSTLIMSMIFLFLIKLFKSRKQYKHVLSVVCASYYFVSIQKIINVVYQILNKENNNRNSSAILTIVDDIFKNYNIFTLTFIIFVIIGLYVVTHIDKIKIITGILLIEIINLIMIVFTSILSFNTEQLISLKKALLSILKIG